MTVSKVALIHEAGLVSSSYRQEEAVSSPLSPLQRCRSPVFSQPLALDALLMAHSQWGALSQGLLEWTLALSLVRRAILSPAHAPISSLVRIYRKTAQLLHVSTKC